MRKSGDLTCILISVYELGPIKPEVPRLRGPRSGPGIITFATYVTLSFISATLAGYGQNGDKPKRRQDSD